MPNNRLRVPEGMADELGRGGQRLFDAENRLKETWAGQAPNSYFMSISTTVKTIQDIMRKDAGVDGDAQRISQLVWLFFLKIFDDGEAERELLEDDYRSPLPERLRCRNWAADAEGITGETLADFINSDLFKTLKALTAPDAKAQLVRHVFEEANNYMKSGTLLRQVVNKVNDINFNRRDDRHLFGDIYEQILRDLQSAGNAGEFYTPRAVTQFMVEMVNPRLGEQMLDPACGTGGFLTNTIEHLRRQVKSIEDETVLQASFRGVEKKQLPYFLCVTNLMLHGIDTPNQVAHDNTLARPYRDYTPADRVDAIITNPPFGGMEEDGIEKNFPQAYSTRETADLFLVLIIHLLREGGRGAIVLPDGTLFGEGVKTRIKEKLLTEGLREERNKKRRCAYNTFYTLSFYQTQRIIRFLSEFSYPKTQRIILLLLCSKFSKTLPPILEVPNGVL